MLHQLEQGDTSARQKLFDLVYGELREIAAAKMSREVDAHTLQPTALVHEAWLRLGGDAQPHWQNRAHFFGAAAEAMRRILIASARRRHAVRHGGGLERAGAEVLEQLSTAEPPEQILAMDEALEKLALADPQKAELVKLRYFAGMTIDETAELMGISAPTAKRWWAYARAWLHREIRT